jgi:uncharacterized protein YdhG (YjbR/CyaY superfamily)
VWAGFRAALDVYTADEAGEVQRLIALDATEVHWSKRPPDADYVILADPEGNRFCVVDINESGGFPMPTQTTTKPAAKATRVKTVNDYLAAAPKDKRAALTKLRETIKAAAPKASEAMSYGIVGFKLRRKPVVYFGYWKTHYALYGMGSRATDAHAAELKDRVSSKGAIQFPADQPLPYRLVTKMVKARVAEIEKAG